MIEHLFDPDHLKDPHPIRPRPERRLGKRQLRDLAAAQESAQETRSFRRSGGVFPSRPCAPQIDAMA
ncbi:hypothetical protein [Rhodovulum euryhalinum]|uniref:hypothetical protein n=1 Tax=Rhodovulum euryhalinum TaxID=35805 RepID=UPI001051EE96|nr:hypothetical protein [Rhodovulum euryhalinum]